MGDLKVGDAVLISNRYGKSKSIISRETRTQWIVMGVGNGSERRFRKSDLAEVGATPYHSSRIELLTKAHIMDFKLRSARKCLVDKVNDSKSISKLTLEEINEIIGKLS